MRNMMNQIMKHSCRIAIEAGRLSEHCPYRVIISYQFTDTTYY